MADDPTQVMLRCPECGQQVCAAPDQLNDVTAVVQCPACGREAAVTVSTDAIKEQAAEEVKSHLQKDF